MKYMLLIYEDEKNWVNADKQTQDQIFGEYMAFTEGIKNSGKHVAGDALHPIQSATTVRVRDGKTLKTDGPFAETREQLGGYYIVEAKDLDEACAIAAKIPTSRTGSIEVRPVMVF